MTWELARKILHWHSRKMPLDIAHHGHHAGKLRCGMVHDEQRDTEVK